ncbi:MAG: hypothetical protein LAP85_28025 [Acidobacteriia bacterium]|nr:hypothetical protein [Terriglobia bacterium]
MNKKKSALSHSRRRPSTGRHEAGCRVCVHPEREQIEAEWIGWAHTTKLAKRYGLSRDSLYRHCHALGLFEKRRRNLRAALERLVEEAETVQVNASAVVAAVQALAKINAAGQWVDRTEQVNLNELFERMTVEELETYAREGTLPDWFTSVVGATPITGQEAHGDE